MGVMHNQGCPCSCHGQRDEKSTQGGRRFLTRWLVGNSTIAGVFALLWLLLRSGVRPSRLAYPCQQAALTSAGLALGAPLVAAVVAARRGLVSSMRRPARVIAALLGVIATIAVWGHVERVDASQTRRLQPPSDYRAKVFHVTGCPQQPEGDRFPGLDRLLELMGRNGLKLYRSPGHSTLAAPDGIIGADDVVLIKINYQWAEFGGTNTDLLSGLIRAIVDHPDGFSGEVVVCENAQEYSIMRFDRPDNNAEDRARSPHKVVENFRNQGFAVSHYDWMMLRATQVDEFADGDDEDGYLMLDYDPTTFNYVTYPKFRTEYGTSVSVKEGIWDPANGRYDRDRLKFINLPVLKPHSGRNGYGATGCIKNYMGLVSQTLTNSHIGVRRGLMGVVLAEIGLADLNILDCTWISYSPAWGPMVYYDGPVTRADQLVASTDPIAADVWAVRNILVPAFEMDGYPPEPLPAPSADPEDPDSAFRTYIDNSMEALLAAGLEVTNDLDAIDVVGADASRAQPGPRRPSRRVRPVG
jgi:hypothetical protein